jgi:hypothetical protein
MPPKVKSHILCASMCCVCAHVCVCVCVDVDWGRGYGATTLSHLAL